MKRQTDKQTDRLAAHVFVCVNDRDSEHACCAAVGGEETTTAVKAWLRERNAFWSPVGVSTTDCLGLCSEAGTAITIQPQNEWYAEVTPEEVPALLSSAFGPDAKNV
jgi:(2Fe-2S) ferredoxin